MPLDIGLGAPKTGGVRGPAGRSRGFTTNQSKRARNAKQRPGQGSHRVYRLAEAVAGATQVRRGEVADEGIARRASDIGGDRYIITLNARGGLESDGELLSQSIAKARPFCISKGAELGRQAKLLRPNLHVIYLSGYYSEIERASRPIHCVLLEKPVRPPELLNAIKRELRI